MKRLFFISSWGLALILSGCSDQPQTEAKKVEKPVEPISGQTAIYRMYQVARSWAPDAQVLTMNSIHLTDVPEVRGKAGAWQVTFVSESKNSARSYTYSVEEAEPNLHQGVFPGQPESWSASGGSTKPFLIAAVKTDTDAAYKTALAHAGDSAKLNERQTISFLLEKQTKFTNATWRVIWGESVGTSALSVFVDATTGSYLETMH